MINCLVEIRGDIMANKIAGLTIEIGGNTQPLQKALGDVNKKSKDLKTELKDVNKLLKLDPGNVELIAQKQKLLGDSVENTAEKLKRLKDAQADVNAQFKKGDISEEQYRAFNREIAKTEQELKGLSTQLEKTGRDWKELGGKVEAAGDKIKGVGSKLSTTVTAPLVAGFGLAVEGTRELRDDLAKLDTNAKTSGNSVEGMRDSLKDLNQISEETDSNIEALANLMAADLDDNQIQKAVENLAGAAIKFPDTMKIEGMADGLQETLATGKAIGPFAELLERMGVDIEVFDEGLAKAAESGDATNYALDELAKLGLANTTEAFRENNKALVESKDAQFDMMSELAEIGATLEPVMTTIKEAVTGVMEAFNGMSPEGQKVVLVILAIVAAIGPLLVVIGSIVSAVGVLIPVVAGISLPVVAVVATIAALVAAGVLLWQNWDTVKAKAKAFGDGLKNTFDSVKTKITEIIDKIKLAFSNIFSGNIKLPKFGYTGSLNPTKWLKEGLPKLNIKWNAEGGIFTSPTVLPTLAGLQGFGEAGAEAIMPLSKLPSLMADAMKQVGVYKVGGNINVHITGQGASQLNEASIAKVVEQRIIATISQDNRRLPNRASIIPM